jgi:hypothetical protein
VQSYLERRAGAAPERLWATDHPGDDAIRLVAARVVSTDGQLLASATADTPIVVELELDAGTTTEVAVGFDLETEDGSVVLSSFVPQDRAPLRVGRNRLQAEIPAGLLNGGRFAIGLRASRQGAGQVFHVSGAVQFEVVSGDSDVLYGLKRQGAVAPPLAWRQLGE